MAISSEPSARAGTPASRCVSIPPDRSSRQPGTRTETRSTTSTRTDPRSKVTKLGYDTTYPADVTTITNPLQNVWTIGHDDLGRVTSFKDPLQHETERVYGDGVD